MQINSIKLSCFRNIEDAYIEFSPGVTVFCGKNGQGKTNLLEAVYIPARGRSFLTSHENEFIRFDNDLCSLETMYNDGRNQKIVFRWMRSGNTVRRFCSRNNVPITRLSDLVGGFRAVLFCPFHLSLVQDGPSERRKFLDIAISQTDNSYLRSLQKYSSLLAERNALIKTARERRDDGIFLSMNDIYAEQMANEAEIISAKRDEYVKKLSPFVSEIVGDMTKETEIVSISYDDRHEKEYYRKLLTENGERELKTGITLYGVHKDDLKIALNGREARIYASQGQQKSIALSMKLAEGEISRSITGQYPVYLLDDILSELDSGRKKYLLGGMKDKQVIITTCENVEFQNSKVYKVENGVFRPE